LEVFDTLQEHTNHLFHKDVPESELYKCVHCGFCLQACPTYLETSLETESPRGRIALMKAVNENRIDISPNVIRHWDLCIQCRACETACPSGVEYGKLIEGTMKHILPIRKTNKISKLLSKIIMNIVINKNLLNILFNLIKFYQQYGIQKLVRKTKLLNIIMPKIAELERSLPFIPSKSFKTNGQLLKSNKERKKKVALLSGCLMPFIHGPEMDAVTRILNYNGCDVIVPKDQVCCGALHSHVGNMDKTIELAKKNIDTFLQPDIDSIITASAGCGSRMKEYYNLFQEDSEYLQKAKDFSSKTKDISEFLVDLPFEPPKGFIKRTVTYQDSCHLLNAQKISNPPREILNSIPGIKFVELKNSSVCCGGGGTYTITERDLSKKVLASKMHEINNSNASIVTTSNPGCVIQMQYGVQLFKTETKICYVTDILDEAYQISNY
tara:strand:+ start:9056 stop:10372 length:1317 start_codon:yes stop_codon:yes gene_type:complete